MEQEGNGDTICDLGIRAIHKGFVKRLKDLEIRGQVGIIQTTAQLRSARILRRVQETWGNSLSLKL